jgi:hypothetical protein
MLTTSMLLARFPSQYLNLPGTCLTGAQVCMMDVYRLSSFLLFVCRRDTDSYLKDVTRDNIQLLVNEVWKVTLFVQLTECLHKPLVQAVYAYIMSMF